MRVISSFEWFLHILIWELQQQIKDISYWRSTPSCWESEYKMFLPNECIFLKTEWIYYLYRNVSDTKNYETKALIVCYAVNTDLFW